MKAQRQVSGGVAVAAAQPMSAHALPGGIADERLTNGVRCAGVSGMNRQADTQNTRGGGHNCLAWLSEPADRATRSLGSSGGERKEGFQFAEGFSNESRSKVWLTRSASLMGAGRGFLLVLISCLRGLVFLLLNREEAIAFSSAFGDCHSLRAVGCWAAAEGCRKNTSVWCGGESFVGSNCISDF